MPKSSRTFRPKGGFGQTGRGRVSKLAQTLGLTGIQAEIIAAVRQFVDRVIIPTAQDLERSDTYPQDIVDAMRAANP